MTRYTKIFEGGLGMELRFWTDPETGLPHIFNHGVTEEEVRQVLGKGLQAYRRATRRKKR
jgi:hypothetical protein